MTQQCESDGLRAVQLGGRWRLDGPGPADLTVINEFLGYVADRGYSPRMERAYAFDLLAFARWLVDQNLAVGEVAIDDLLRFLTFCRTAMLPGQAGGNVVPLRTGRSTGYAPSTINRRMAAISGLFEFRAMRDPSLVNPVPRSAAVRRSTTGQRGGLLAHLGRPKSRSRLRVREPRRLPRGLDRDETAALLGSFRSDRDRAIAGLMLFSGLRSAEVLNLQVRDVDIPRRWVRVVGKGDKERTVPLDVDVAGLVQTYLLAERPESASTTLFLVAKGSHRGQPLTPAGLRTVFRYHRVVAGVPAGNPHALRHCKGTRLINKDVPQEVVRVLLDHTSGEMTAHYARLHDTTVRRHWENARKVNATGQNVTIDPDGPLAEANWAKQRLGRATQALPNGFCGLPVQKTCPHANACLTCPMFVTTPQFLPQHREQRHHVLQIISTAETRGQTRMLDMNRQVLSNLDKIITALESDVPPARENTDAS